MRFVNAALFCLILPFNAATEAQTITMTMDEAKQAALAYNLNVLQADQNTNAAQAGVMAAYGGYLPSLSAAGSWGRYQSESGAIVQTTPGTSIVIPQGTTTNTTTNIGAGLNLSWTLFDGLSRQGQIGQATSRSVATELTAVRTRQSIVFLTESNYLNVLRNEQLVKVSDETLKRDNRQLEKITESNRVGAAALADVYRQQSTVANDELALITAQNTYDKSKADLVALMGLDVSRNYSFADSSISLDISRGELDSTSAKYTSFASLSERAITSRPDYKGARESFDAAQSGVTIARSGYLPSLSATAGYNFSSDQFNTLNENKNMNWGVSLRWTLFDGFQTNLSLQSAIANRRIAEIGLTQAERDINAQLKKALLDLEAARKQYEVSQKGLVSATEDSKIAEERYNLGAGTLLDLLTANTNLVSAKANLVNAVYNYVTSKRNVEYTLGERTY